MADPIPYVVETSGGKSAAPVGSVPIALYGAGGGGGGAVESVNGQTGEVTLDAADVGALPDSTVIPSAPADIGAATAAQGALADSAVQPAALSGKLNVSEFASLNEVGYLKAIYIANDAPDPTDLEDYTAVFRLEP